MNILAKLTTAAALVLFSGGVTLAECVDVDTTAPTSTDLKTPPIEKDGSQAPLETEARAGAEANAGESETGPVQKDGGTMPLASDEADDNSDLATSQQDVKAQQEGRQTAAAEAKAC